MWNWITKLEELQKNNLAVVVATVIDCSGSVPRGPGAKMIVTEDGTSFGTVGGGTTEYNAINDAVEMIKKGSSSHKKNYLLDQKSGQCCGGNVEIFFDVVNKKTDLYIFGAGHVAQALSHVLTGTPFKVHIIDERENVINSDKIADHVVRHNQEWDEFIKDAKWKPEESLVAIMTHAHRFDLEIVDNILNLKFRYLGLMGSKSKWQTFKTRLVENGFNDQQISKVKCPIGLKLGGKSPSEVAISIASELLTIYYEKQ